MTTKSCIIYCTGIIIAQLLIITGIALVVTQVFQAVLHNLVKKQIVLKEGADVFKSWQNPPPPVYMEYYFFNVTNAEAVIQGGKPSVEEIGPYTYREYRSRENVTFLENGTMVSALSPKTFVFLRDMSSGDPEVDLITTVNIPAVKNATSDDQFVFHTGIQDYKDFGKIVSWNGESKMKWWSSNESNMISGSDGSSFHPLIGKNESLSIFSPDLCRSIYVNFEKEVEIKGIPAYRFSIPSEVLASPEINPANTGFCVPAGKCLGTGVLKVSVCRKGAPVVVSFPHFYQADQKYVDAIEGLSPNKDDHETFLDINPLTGFPVRASKRAQINILVDRIVGFPITKNLNQTIFPVMFINESVVIDDASAKRVRTLLLISTIVTNFPLIIVGLGALLLGVLIILLCRSRMQKKPIAKEDTAYTQVGEKPEESCENNSCANIQLKTYTST
ncbi:lysosome membrane protein 2-like isoform X2 [Polyodon spathula]|uniref:lysosome membrane protein 2-like isoform X2 n=1 Tax=Polyodon spathula TaxID=7913 RepID=UPI001B7EFB91|nr:lysosome membrane protein 2-like isoform X2 [Polyodon spathula]